VSRAASASSLGPAFGRGHWWLFSLVLLGSVLTAVGAIIGNGNLLPVFAPLALIIALWAIWIAPLRILPVFAPLALIIALWAIWIAPLRIPLFWIAFLTLTLDATGDGPWDSPVSKLGALLDLNLNQLIPIPALAVPGVAVILGYLLVVHAHRRLSGSQIDDAGRVGVAPPIQWAILASFLTVVALFALGYGTGGNTQMAKIQVQTFVMILMAGYLLAVAVRGMRDIRILGAIVVAAACLKSLLALYVVNTGTLLQNGDEPAFATSHGDSVLFACGVAIVLAHLAERPSRRRVVAGLLLLPILIGGVLANNRRIAWAEIAAAGVLFFVLARRSRFKQFLLRGLLLALPVLIMYVAVGWSSSAKIFAPVRTFRSMQDAQVDSSTMFRDLENFNLLQTMRLHPWVGSGFGQPFAMVVQTPDISFFREYPYMPHNSILGLWAFCGLLGFTTLFMVLAVCVHLAARSYHLARSPDERSAAFVAIAMVLIYEIQCWGDIGFSERRNIFLVGAACAVASRLAVSTGAWGQFRATVRRA
jgi:O-antigen ligase